MIPGKTGQKFVYNFSEAVKDFFEKSNFIWFEGTNSGMKDGKPVIYDWCANLTVSKGHLINSRGVVLWPR